MKNDEELIWRIAGGSGDGIDSTGTNFTTALMRSGLNVYTHRHYPSRIRGGHTYWETRATDREIKSRGDGYNLLLALGDSFARAPDEDAIYGDEEIKPLSENLDDLREDGVIVYDEGLIDIDDVPNFEEKVEKKNLHVYPVDLRGIAKEHGREVMRNTAGVGAMCALVDLSLQPIKDVMSENMPDKILDPNLEILEETYNKVKDEFDFTHDWTAPEGEHDEEQVLLSGSHGIAYASLDSGCRFISGYPMTPWTDVFSIMSQQLPEFGGVAEQVEDEIAAASMAIGASHAGAKAMSGSSGGGFALMSEPLGLAEMSETPVVLIEAMRGGPSTGLPTKPEQADLEHVLYTSQGDSGRVLFAPGSVQEAYEQTRQAFKIAYDYHLPAIILYDQKLSGSQTNVPKSFFDREPDADLGKTLSEDEIEEIKPDDAQDFPRFQYDAEKGVSPRTIPGQKDGRYKTTGNEHDEYGYISEDPVNRKTQVDRRFSKFPHIREEMAAEGNQTHFGPEDADYGIMSFGSTQGVLREAVEDLNEEGESVKSLSVSDIMPFATDEVKEFIESVDEVMVVEMNASAQFRHHVQRELGGYGEKLVSLLKYTGNPFEPAEIKEAYHTRREGGTETTTNTRLEVSELKEIIRETGTEKGAATGD